MSWAQDHLPGAGGNNSCSVHTHIMLAVWSLLLYQIHAVRKTLHTASMVHSSCAAPSSLLLLSTHQVDVSTIGGVSLLSLSD